MKVAVFRENGACEIFVNGIVNEEIKKMKERYEKELSVMEAKLQAKTGHLNKNLHKDLMAVKVMVAQPVSLIERIRERIIITWCQIYGIGEALKLWSYDGNRKD